MKSRSKPKAQKERLIRAFGNTPYPGLSVDYRKKITMPIHDMANDGRIVVCVDVYGVDPMDLAVVPVCQKGYDVVIGSKPMIKAVERLGLDPLRYQAWLWDIPLG